MNYPRRQYRAPRPTTANNVRPTSAVSEAKSSPTIPGGRNYFSASPDDLPQFTPATNGVRTGNFNRHNKRPKNSGKNWNSSPKGEGINRPVYSKNSPSRPKNSRINRRKLSPSNPKINIDAEMAGAENGEMKEEKPKKIPPLEAGNIRVITFGGVEEIGKNMMAIEFDGDIIVVDIGFLFPGEDAPGVDYIIPDTTYLEERKHMIRGVVITHGHLDHIGGIPYIMPKIGNPPIYTSLLTAVMIKKRQEEFPHLPKLNIQVVDQKDVLRLGKLRVRFFDTTHTIPDSLGVIIETPYGNIIITGDFKIEHKDGQPTAEEEKQYGELGKEKNLLLMPDSTNVERTGFSFSEKEVQENVKKIIEGVKGRVIIGSFSSLFERIIYIIMACEALGKKVAIEGRSMGGLPILGIM